MDGRLVTPIIAKGKLTEGGRCFSIVVTRADGEQPIHVLKYERIKDAILY